MTSSATQTEADKGRGVRRAARLGGRLDLAVGAAIVAVGWLLVLGFNHWHVTAPVVFLCLGWLAMVLCGFFFWRAALAAATEGTGPDSEGFELSSGRVAELETEKRALLKAIKEVEFDRAMGKMSEPDAAEITRVYRARAIDVLKELEGEGEDGDAADAPLDQVIEREVRARMVLAGILSRRKSPPMPQDAAGAAAPAAANPTAEAATAEAAPAATATEQAAPAEAAPQDPAAAADPAATAGAPAEAEATQGADEADAGDASGPSSGREIERRRDA
jgi:hypothetical protein